MINFMGKLGVKIAERIVRKRSEMDNGVKALQILADKIAKVLSEAGNFGWPCAEVAIGE
jgi:hypothetical protein